MYVNDKFVFLHFPRCGGTFIYEFLYEHFPETKMLGYHYPIDLLPDRYKHLPLIGGVRNPWAFYVSLATRLEEPAFSALLDPPVEGPTEKTQAAITNAIRGMLTVGNDDLAFSRYQQSLPLSYAPERKNSNLSRQCVEDLRGSGLGLMSFLFRRHYRNRHDIHFVRQEYLAEDLIDVFTTLGIQVNEKMRSALVSEHLHALPHRPYSLYYDDDLRDLVAVRDRPIIEQFAYTFAPFETWSRNHVPLARSGFEFLESLDRQCMSVATEDQIYERFEVDSDDWVTFKVMCKHVAVNRGRQRDLEALSDESGISLPVWIEFLTALDSYVERA